MNLDNTRLILRSLKAKLPPQSSGWFARLQNTLVFGTIWRLRRRLLTVAGCYALLAILYCNLAPRGYEARVLIAPLDQGTATDISASTSSLLATASSLLGQTMNNGSVYDELDEMLYSQKAAEQVVTDSDLMHRLFSDQWSAKAGRWHPPRSPIGLAILGIKAILGMPAWSPPDANTVRKYITNNIVITQMDDPTFRQITFTHKVPDVALALVLTDLKGADRAVKDAHAQQATAFRDYLMAELQKVSDVNLREGIITAILEQERTLTLASNSGLFAVRILDAYVPKNPTSPNYLLSLLAFIALAIFTCGGIVIWSLLQQTHQPTHPQDVKTGVGTKY